MKCVSDRGQSTDSAGVWSQFHEIPKDSEPAEEVGFSMVSSKGDTQWKSKQMVF